MNPTNDGGPAFPHHETTSTGEAYHDHLGMSLHDWYVGMADIPWNAVIDALGQKYPNRKFTAIEIIKYRVALKHLEADAMLAARRKEEEPPLTDKDLEVFNGRTKTMKTPSEKAREMAEKCAKAYLLGTNPEAGLFAGPRTHREVNKLANIILSELQLESLIEDKEKLLQCCSFTADGKPVKLGSTLYLYPNNDIGREPMTLKVPDANNYCWYESIEDARTAVMKKGEGE